MGFSYIGENECAQFHREFLMMVWVPDPKSGPRGREGEEKT